MKLPAFLKDRRQQRARKRHEREKAARERSQREGEVERVANVAKDLGGGGGFGQ